MRDAEGVFRMNAQIDEEMDRPPHAQKHKQNGNQNEFAVGSPQQCHHLAILGLCNLEFTQKRWTSETIEIFRPAPLLCRARLSDHQTANLDSHSS